MLIEHQEAFRGNLWQFHIPLYSWLPGISEITVKLKCKMSVWKLHGCWEDPELYSVVTTLHDTTQTFVYFFWPCLTLLYSPLFTFGTQCLRMWKFHVLMMKELVQCVTCYKVFHLYHMPQYCRYIPLFVPCLGLRDYLFCN